MLPNLPKLADRNFIIGFLLPTVLGGLAMMAIFHDIPAVMRLWSDIGRSTSLDTIKNLTLALGVMWFVAVLLLVSNYSLYRLLEGYVGPFNCDAWRRAQVLRFKTQRRALERRHRNIGQASEKEQDSYLRALQSFRKEFPHEAQFVLPTRFGNRLRACEVYSSRVYNVDSIPAWIRLSAVIPKSYQSLIDEEHAQADFYVNLFFFSLLIAACAGVRLVETMVGSLMGFEHISVALFYGAWLAGAAAAAYVCYEGAIARAASWGDLVRAAFDLYLPSLAKQMGYDLPSTRAERENFWSAVTSMFLYADALQPEDWPRAQSRPVAPHGDDEANGDDTADD